MTNQFIKMRDDGDNETYLSKRNKGYESCYFNRMYENARQDSLVDPKFIENCPEDHYVGHVSAFRMRVKTKTGRVLKKRTDKLYVEKFVYVPIKDVIHGDFELRNRLIELLYVNAFEDISDSDKELGVYRLAYSDIQWFKEKKQWKDHATYEFDFFPKHLRDGLIANQKKEL